MNRDRRASLFAPISRLGTLALLLCTLSCGKNEESGKPADANEPKAKSGERSRSGSPGSSPNDPATKSGRRPPTPTAPKMTTTESGLQYEVLKEGDGPRPGPTDKVNVHYHGTLPDGTVFDSSVDRGQTISFGLHQVIKGWTEGVQLMKVGSKYRFVIPPELAYGAAGAPPSIPPNATLTFEVELFKIE